MATLQTDRILLFFVEPLLATDCFIFLIQIYQSPAKIALYF